SGGTQITHPAQLQFFPRRMPAARLTSSPSPTTLLLRHAMTQTLSPKAAPARTSTSAPFLKRILDEGYGPGARHGADLKAALSDVPASVAFRRPGAKRHNIAEIVMHHAWCIRSVTSQLSGNEAEKFVLPGEDWFPLNEEADLGWKKVLGTLEQQQRGLSAVI